MKKEILAKAKELEKDIQEMESALSYYKRGEWRHWEYANDRASSFHFEFCKNWSHRDADMQNLPAWLNKPLMDVVERELERCKHELETLGDGRKTDAVDDAEEEVEIPVTSKGVCNKPHEETWKDRSVKTIDRMVSWMLYSMTFCFLFGVAGLNLSAREIVSYSLMLGLVVGSINNIERVMRELFRKED